MAALTIREKQEHWIVFVFLFKATYFDQPLAIILKHKDDKDDT